MLLYILKFSGCLLIFMVFYKLFLERESFHNIKRFYLISALFLSISIPFIAFTEYVEVSPVTYSNTEFVPDTVETIIKTSWKDYIPNIFWSIYVIGILIFSFRFIKHLYQMHFRIKNNVKLKDKKFTNVLLLDKINPHTFFKYIFLNKQKYESNAIPKEVMLHEQTHAKQLHAIDIILTELIQVVFWFNPLLYFIKKDIKLNHEFLADQSVLKVGTEPTNYQQLLLAFSSNACEPQLANAINYSSIKKRLTVMKTQTTKSTTWIKSLLLLPLLAMLIYSFSSEKVEYLYAETNHSARSMSIEILENDIYSIDGIRVHKNSMVEVVNKMHQDITPEIRNRIMNIHVSSSEKITNKETWFIYNSLLDYGFHRMVTPDQEIILSKGNTPFAVNANNEKPLIINIQGDTVSINGKPSSLETFREDLNTLTKSWEETDYTSTKVKLYLSKADEVYLKLLEDEFSKTHYSKANEGSKLFPESLEPLKKYTRSSYDQEGASSEQMKAYNTWAKKINKQIELAIKKENSNSPKPYPIIKLKEVEKYKYIYQLMSDKQRKDAEPFPNLPEAPFPPPPPPKAPLDHIIDMAKKNALFYLEGKKVSSDKAIDALKKNKKLNISTKNSNTKQPEVYITKKGVTIKKNNPSPKTGFLNVDGEKLFYTVINDKITYYNRYGVVTDKNGKELQPNLQTNSSEILPNTNITKVFKDDQIVSEFKNTGSDTYITESSKEIPSMLQLLNKGAKFYFEEEEISGKKAIKLTDTNKDLNILIRGIDSKKPIVKISTQPIRI